MHARKESKRSTSSNGLKWKYNKTSECRTKQIKTEQVRSTVDQDRAAQDQRLCAHPLNPQHCIQARKNFWSANPKTGQDRRWLCQQSNILSPLSGGSVSSPLHLSLLKEERSQQEVRARQLYLVGFPPLSKPPYNSFSNFVPRSEKKHSCGTDLSCRITCSCFVRAAVALSLHLSFLLSLFPLSSLSLHIIFFYSVPSLIFSLSLSALAFPFLPTQVWFF